MKCKLIITTCLIMLLACRNKENLHANFSKKAKTMDARATVTLDSIVQQFHSDYLNNQMKYYYTSIHYPSKKMIQYMQDSLQIKIISTNEVINQEYNQYNEEVQKIIFLTRKLKINAIIKLKNNFPTN